MRHAPISYHVILVCDWLTACHLLCKMRSSNLLKSKDVAQSLQFSTPANPLAIGCEAVPEAVWCRQWAKVTRHTTTPLGDFTLPTSRFQHVHVRVTNMFDCCSQFLFTLQYPTNTSGFNFSFQEVNKTHQMKPQNAKSYPTSGTVIIGSTHSVNRPLLLVHNRNVFSAVLLAIYLVLLFFSSRVDGKSLFFETFLCSVNNVKSLRCSQKSSLFQTAAFLIHP
jgi:hypothetical protein